MPMPMLGFPWKVCLPEPLSSCFVGSQLLSYFLVLEILELESLRHVQQLFLEIIFYIRKQKIENIFVVLRDRR